LEPLAVARALAVVCGVTLLPGWALTRATRAPADLFVRTWTGLAVTSLLGLALAYAGLFSLGHLLGGVAAIAAAGLATGRIAHARGPRETRATAKARAQHSASAAQQCIDARQFCRSCRRKNARGHALRNTQGSAGARRNARRRRH